MLRRVVALLALWGAATPAFAETYGSGVTLKTPTKVSAIYAAPGDYLGRAVLVEGIVVDVCAKRGCWLELASDQKFQTLGVKVPDGVVVFPMSARGKVARVQGTLQEVPRSKSDEKWGWQRHPPADTDAMKEPAGRYQLHATGAEIQ